MFSESHNQGHDDVYEILYHLLIVYEISEYKFSSIFHGGFGGGDKFSLVNILFVLTAGICLTC